MINILVVGGTSAIARACIGAWASKEKCNFILVVRNILEGQKIEDDIRIKYNGSSASIFKVDFNSVTDIGDLIKNIYSKHRINVALIAHGYLPIQKKCEKDYLLAVDNYNINLISPIIFSENIIDSFKRQGCGTLAILGSVAGDRGRRSNYFYGSAKAGLENYMQGLQHRLHETNITAILVKPGPTDTPMTAGFKGKINLADVNTVAQDIIIGIKKKKSIIYTPKKWEIIMAVIKILPRSIFNRIDI